MHNATEQLEEARRSYRLGRFVEAEALFRQLVREQPENPLCYEGLGLSLLYLERYDEAISVLARALELDPQLAMSHGALGQVYLKQREYERAKAELETALQIDPDDSVTRTLFGVLYLEQGSYNEARKELELAIANDPQQVLAYVNLGTVYVRKGQLAKGLSTYWKATKVDPKSWVYVIGRIFDIPLLYMQRLPLLLRVCLAIVLALLVVGRNPLSWPIWFITSAVVVVRSTMYIFVERHLRAGILWLLVIIVGTGVFLLRPT